MSAVAKQKTTAAAYLEFERGADEKHEFYDGLIYAMAGGSLNHSLIAAKLVSKIDGALSGKPCRVTGSDLRVSADEDGVYFYPDASGFCGPPLLTDGNRDTLLNPSFIAEVLSDSTEAFDRGDKFAAYREIESFEEYLLVSQWEIRAELFQRQSDGRWLLSVMKDEKQVIKLRSLGCEFSLKDLYEGVEFEEREAKSSA